MGNLTQEIIDKHSSRDSKIGAHLKCLLQFSIIGFIENLNDMDRVRKVLDDENVDYDLNHSRYVLWLEEGSISDTLKTFLKKKQNKDEKRIKDRN